MTDFAFAPGEFKSFRAKTSIHLGKLQLNLKEGEIVEFDGQVLRVGGDTHPYPEFRAGVRAGWIVPIEDNISNYRPKAAGVQVRSAQDNTRKTVSTEVSEDDTYAGPARRPKVVVQDDTEEVEVKRFAVKREDDMGLNVAPARPESRKKVSSGVGIDGLNEDVVADASAAAREASRLDNAPPPRAVLATKNDVHAAASDKVENIIDAIDADTRARMLAEQRKAQIAKSEAEANPKPVAEAKPAPKVAAPKPAPQPEKTAKAAPKAKIEAPPRTVEEFIVRDGLVEIHPGVKWDKSLHWRTRAKIALDQYAGDADAFAAIKAFETPAVVQLIETNAGRKS
jgi:hypothetical protein